MWKLYPEMVKIGSYDVSEHKVVNELYRNNLSQDSVKEKYQFYLNIIMKF